MNTKQLKTMMSMQNTMNLKVHPHWESQGFAWGRAIMVEGVEALEHYGWKWWKKQTPDMPQVQMELVDIWHFILSYYIEHHGPDAAARIQQSISDVAKNGYWIERPIRLNFDKLISEAAIGGVHMPAFVGLMHQCALSEDDLYAQYVAKNVLNTFRQDHGYKAGTYIKDWNGKEDNVVLTEIMSNASDLAPDELYVLLKGAYADVVGVKL